MKQYGKALLGAVPVLGLMALFLVLGVHPAHAAVDASVSATLSDITDNVNAVKNSGSTIVLAGIGLAVLGVAAAVGLKKLGYFKQHA